MPKPKIVSDYLEAAIPKGLTESRRKLLTDELESHICDKAEHYMEIGYSEEKSFEKAVTEMGEADPVRESFEKIYKESWIVNALIVLGAIPLNFLATFLGFDYAYFGHTWDIPTPIYAFISTALASVSLLSILYLYRKRKENRLIAVAVACGLSLLSLVLLGSVFQPLFYSLTQNGIYIIERLKNVELLYTKIPINADSDIFESAVNIGSVVLLLFLGILSFTLAFQCEKNPKKDKRKIRTLPALAAVLAVLTVLNTALFSHTSAVFDKRYDERMQAEYGYKVTDTLRAYALIDSSMSYREADRILRENGLIPFAETELKSSFSREDYDKYTDNGKNILYFHKDDHDTELSLIYYHTPIAVSDTGDKPITFKAYYSDPTELDDALINPDNSPTKLYENFLSFRLGDTVADTVGMIEKYGSGLPICQVVHYDGENTKETYRYQSDFQLPDLLLERLKYIPIWKFSEYSTSVTVELTFENGKLTKGELEGYGSNDKYNFDEIGTMTIK